MADSSANLKVKATMDNADLKKKCKESKDALRDFSQVSEDSVKKLGEAIGIDTDKIDKMANALDGLGLKLQASGDEGVAAFGKIVSSISSAAAGIAGLGIAGAIVGMKALSDEAENFKNTIEGVHIDAAVTGYVDIYKQVLYDFNREVGEEYAQAESGFKKFFGTMFSTIKTFGTSGAAVAIFNPQAKGYGQENIDAFREQIAAAKAAGEEGSRISAKMAEIYAEMALKSDDWAAKEAQIAEFKRIAYDKTVDAVTQQEALAKATDLINERYDEEQGYLIELAKLQTEFNALATPSIANLQKESDLREQALKAVTSKSNAVRELGERQAAVTAAVEAEVRAIEEAVAAEDALMNSRADLMAFAVNTPTAITGNAKAQNAPGIIVPVQPELDEQSVVDITNELQQIMTSSFETIGVALGGLIGDLATGGDAWENFSYVAISAFADLATYVGKTAIATGTATLGIKAALESLNGYVAIAAGVALVALGAAVKASLSNASSGSYSASSGVASASGSYGSSTSGFGTGFETREMTVNVTGTLRADGNQLLTVIENENKRKNHTT